MRRFGQYYIRVGYVCPDGKEAAAQATISEETVAHCNSLLLGDISRNLLENLELTIKAHEGPEVAAQKPNTVAQLTTIEKMVEEAQARLAWKLDTKVRIAKYENSLMFSGKLKEKRVQNLKTKTENQNAESLGA